MDQKTFLDEIEKRESLEHFVSPKSKMRIRTVKDIEQYYAGHTGAENSKYQLLLEQLMRDCVEDLTEKRKIEFKEEQKEKIKKLSSDQRKKLNELLDNGEFPSARDYVESPELDFSKRYTFDNPVFTEFWEHCDEYARAGDGKARFLNGLKEIIESKYKKVLTISTYRRAQEITSSWPKTDANQNSNKTVFTLLSKLNNKFYLTQEITSANGETKADKENGLTVQRMNLPVKMRKESSGDYSGRAPVPEFGFLMDSLDVALILTSRDTVKIQSVAKTIASLCGSITKTQTPLLVLLNRALSRKEWLTLSGVLKTLGDRQTVLVIDWSIMLYAVLTNPENEVDAWDRIMRCAIPLHGLNPFPTSSAYVPPELFAGRKKTISDFLRHTDPANFLYGGRQLGKTAIFNFVKDVSGDTVVQTAILGMSGTQALRSINNKFCEIIPDFDKVDSWEDLAQEIRRATSRIKREGKKLFLFIDEADAFLEQLQCDFDKGYCANDDPIEKLYEIEADRDIGPYFHFAFAGKHNVCRVLKWCKDSGENIDWLEPKTKSVPVNPFTYTEAEELLSKLSYFNILFADNDKSKRRIFNESNYYPGLIHLFCHKAVNKVNEKFLELASNDYDCVKNIGLLNDSDIETIISSAEFQESQRNLFDITLKLTSAEDDAYRCVAYALAFLLLQTGQSAFTKDDVAEKAFRNFKNFDRDRIPMYLNELCELSILDKIGEGTDARYYFKRDRYRGYLRPDGSDDDDEIIYKFWELEAIH